MNTLRSVRRNRRAIAALVAALVLAAGAAATGNVHSLAHPPAAIYVAATSNNNPWPAPLQAPVAR
jgi:alcohol dehydrogenase class IV